MISSLKSLFSHTPPHLQAHAAYGAIVAQARMPVFYSDYGVPDTLDGRFDVIVLHMFLVIHRLRRESSLEAGEFARALQELFFADMDRSVREMGVSDTGVGKRVKQMAQAFYGRIQAYEQGFSNADSLAASLRRNLYRDESNNHQAIKAVVKYCHHAAEALKKQPFDDIMQGAISFS